MAISLPSSTLSSGISNKASAEELATFCQSCASCQKCKDCAACASGAHGQEVAVFVWSVSGPAPCCCCFGRTAPRNRLHGCSLSMCVLALPAHLPVRRVLARPPCACLSTAPTICFLNRGKASCGQCTGCSSCPSSGNQLFTAYEGCAACAACADCCPSFYSACSGCSLCQYCKYCTMQCRR